VCAEPEPWQHGYGGFMRFLPFIGAAPVIIQSWMTMAGCIERNHGDNWAISVLGRWMDGWMDGWMHGWTDR